MSIKLLEGKANLSHFVCGRKYDWVGVKLSAAVILMQQKHQFKSKALHYSDLPEVKVKINLTVVKSL